MRTILYNTDLSTPISGIFPNGYYVDEQKPELPENIVELNWIDNSPPEYNSETQRIESIRVRDRDEYKLQYTIVDLTREEITERLNAEALTLDEEISLDVVKEYIRANITLDSATVDKYLTLYPAYRVGEEYEIGKIIRYKEELYEVIQAHATQFDWKPDELPALYSRIRVIIEEWVQPTGGHDAYNIGDRVIYNGETWESVIDANVWSPVAFPQGWLKIT